ncbi:MAG: glycosyl hydrolase family 18 protein [bacterium]|nr:glycosyl hydrolase family 18 protein [bacterium]
MKRLVPMFVALGLIVLVAAGYFGWKIAERYIPSKDMADLQEVFDTEKDRVSIFFNNELLEEKALYIDGQTYFALDWVNENLNERYYWDSVEKKLVYAMPTQLLSANADTVGSDGKKLLWISEDGVYLSAGLILQYTNVRMEAFDHGEYKRIFVDNIWGTEKTAEFKKNTYVRVKGGIKSDIITTAAKDESAVVLEELDTWTRVRTKDGCIGYVEKRKLSDVKEREQVSFFDEPQYTHITMDKKVCLVFHQVTNKDANANLENLLSMTDGVNVVAPTWFSLTDNEGNFSSLGSKEYVDKAHAMGVQVWGLLDNFSKDVKTEVLLASTTTRQRLVTRLIHAAQELGLDGLNMDFESLKESAGVHYVQFLRELSIACHEEGLVLSVDNYVPSASTRFYNRKEQGNVADYVIIMGYDEHYAGGEPGPVASIDYVERGIAETLKEVPKERVINAVPFYTRLWTEEGGKTTSKALGIKAATNWVQENGVELSWKEDLGLSYGETNSQTQRQFLWMEDARSLQLKADLIRSYDLAGTACWKLGLETADVWSVVGK